MNHESAKSKSENLSIRLATMDDAQLLWEWANDPTVREQSFNAKPIEWESHIKWLSSRMASPDTNFYLLLVDGEPAGQIRYDRDESGRSTEIGFSIAKEHRGKKFGIEILKLSCMRALKELKCRQVTALVIKGNEASYKAFLRAGFIEDGMTEKNGQIAYRFVWKPAEH